MELNWNIEVYMNIFMVAFLWVSIITIFIYPRIRKIKSLFYLRLSLFMYSLTLLFDVFAFLYLNLLFSILGGYATLISTFFLVLTINYLMKEEYYSIPLIITIILAALGFYLGTQPGAASIEQGAGYIRVGWIGSFGFVCDLSTLVFMLLTFYWGFQTYINAPFLIKREAFIFLIGANIFAPISVISYLLLSLNPVFVLISNILFIVSLSCMIYVIIKEPKVLYILPFNVHRLLVKDKGGFPLFDHDWSESQVNETIFTGFINAVQLMSEEVMNIGGLLDINLREGILILHESQYISVGLVASKSSKLLRDSLVNFSKDFEMKFKRQLKKKSNSLSNYEDAIELIEKHFSNFPYKIIKDKTHPLLLSAKFTKLPSQLENKLKTIFPDEEEFLRIKSELIKSPSCVPNEFTDLYDEIKDEINVIPFEEAPLLNEKKSEEE